VNGALGRTAVLVVRKELRDLVRDPRTVLISLVLPLLLFPLLFWILGNYQGADRADAGRFKIAVTGVLPPGYRDTQRLRFLAPADTEGASPGPESLLRSGTADAVLTIGETAGVRQFSVVYDNVDNTSIGAFEALASYIQQQEKAADPAAATQVRAAPLSPPEQARGRLLLSLMLPLLLFLFAVTCPLPFAADLSAGEKERGSLEPLLSTSAPRSGIVMGKFLATLIAGYAGVSAFSLGIFLSCVISPSVIGTEAMTFGLSFPAALLLVLFSLLVSALFAALELAAGLFTRSVREAQLLGMPLLVLSMGAVHIARSIDLRRVPPLYPHLPLVNLALAVRELGLGEPQPGHLAAALLWGSVYLAGTLLVAQRLFNREAVISK